MDLQPLIPWLSFLALVISLGTSITALMTSGAKANTAAIATARASITDLEKRVQSVESDLRHLPDKDSVNELKLSLAELRGVVGTLSESVGRVVRTVDRIEVHLHGDKK